MAVQKSSGGSVRISNPEDLRDEETQGTLGLLLQEAQMHTYLLIYLVNYMCDANLTRDDVLDQIGE